MMLSVAGCRTAPESGSSPDAVPPVSIINVAQEKSFSENAWNEFKNSRKPTADLQMNDAMMRLGMELSTAAERPDYQWEMLAYEDKQANAFCLAGGKLAVSSAMFRCAGNDAELAALLADEIARALERHHAERISRALALKSEDPGAAVMQSCGMAENATVIPPFSRKQLIDADARALKLMAAAGYDPRLAIDFWNKLIKQEKNPDFKLYIAAHPFDRERLAALRKNLTAAVLIYEASKVKRGAGQTYTFAAPPPVAPPATDPSKISPDAPAKLPPPDQPQICSRNDLGFAIRVPLEWAQKSGGMGITLSSPSREEIISIQGVYSAQNGGSYIGVSELVDAISSQITGSHKSSRIYRNEPTDVQGRLGQEFNVDLTKGDQQYRQWFVVFPRYDGKMFYVFSYTTSSKLFSEGQGGAKKIFRTFHFISDEQEGLKKRHASPLSVDSFLDNGKDKNSSKTSILGF